MRDADRFRLLGTYRTPRVRVGSVLSCESRDCDVIVVGYADGRIPWPLGRRRGSGARGLILFGDLARAVRRESNQAVCHWWGVEEQTVTKWRKALAVKLTNAGTLRLRKDYTREDWFIAARKKGQAKACGPERRRKLSEALKGRPRPPHVRVAMLRAAKGRKVSAETRRKLAAAMRERARLFVPNGRRWTVREDRLVRTLPAPEVARRTRRTLRSVYDRRARLGVPDGRAGNGKHFSPSAR
jgi:hypothetical protein